VSKEQKNGELFEEVELAKENLSSSGDGDEIIVDGVDETIGAAEPRNLEKELADALAEVDNLRDKMLRAAAENENFKKRMERERAASLKYAGERIFREILPVVDNLERAIALRENGEHDVEETLESFVEGVKLTLKSLVSTLEKFEVKPVESIGKPFDPEHQEALTMEPSETVPASHVVKEFEKGYYYKDRLLRAAKVIVSSGKA